MNISKDQIPPELINEARHYVNDNRISFVFEEPEKVIEKLEKEIQERIDEIDRIKKDQELRLSQKQRMVAFLESIGEPIEYPKEKP